ncbi:MAG: class II fructose-bisphosphate aldolase [Syntrophales bacterium]|jgi:fructose/tagatose bisphosphate aldolase|nr:class II fructose-bisphosphate aldolase [Syntrophales bacterium]MCK9527702.1 class II fructose-bisphosphate aldolase [Syntrophales bacterium]MDX9921643.1 class II fructose-bisphosphate aldolase [Syntrophales bacterium]
MIVSTIDDLKKITEGILRLEPDRVDVLDEQRLRKDLVDDLIYTAVFSPREDVREAAAWIIRRAGASLDILPSSIQSLYDAMGRGTISDFTVPAINLRGITYHSARAVLRSAMAIDAGAFIFEIARSEIGYTSQRPAEYTTAVTAAAIKTGYRGALFLQGDHFQMNAKKYAADPSAETGAVEDLIIEAVEGGFYNIDIDASTLVDLSRPTLGEQQEDNYRITADLTKLIRSIEPAGITISVGGEIGEVGSKNTTVEEFIAFMEGYNEALEDEHAGVMKGISKISIQTGTTHGGVPLPDGSIASVKIDFDTLRSISEIARTRYGLAGAVQHGASTLPEDAFDHFPRTGTAEIHLATGFQNIIYDSDNFPGALKKSVYDYINTELRNEKKEQDTEEQFIYKTRKKGFGPFKKELWHLDASILEAIGSELEDRFSLLFDKLAISGTRASVEELIETIDVPIQAPAALHL